MKSDGKICSDCIHYCACAAWNVGSLANTDAGNCVNFQAEGVRQKISWTPFTPGTMPPIDNHRRFLVLYGLDPDDRILCVGKHVQYNGAAPYIRIIGGEGGWKELTEDQQHDAAWAPVEIADEAVKGCKEWKAEIMKLLRKKSA